MAQGESAGQATVLAPRDEPRWWSPVLGEIVGVAKEPRGLIALVILAALFVFAFVVPIFDTTDPNFILREPKNLAPTMAHPMGTDHLSRDLLARNSVGLQRTIVNGLGAVIVGWLAGIAVGYTAGWRGGWTDIAIMRGVDTLLAFPGILLAIVLITIMGPGLLSVGVAIAVFNIPTSARLARAGVLREREREYVTAARAMGASGTRILFRHVAINTFGAFTVQLPIAVVASVLIMAALNFLGLGDKPPAPTLGQLLLDGSRFMRDAPHYVLGPVVLLALMMAALNFLSDVLSERLDPVRRRAV